MVEDARRDIALDAEGNTHWTDHTGRFRSDKIEPCGAPGCVNLIDMIYEDHEVRYGPGGESIPYCLTGGQDGEAHEHPGDAPPGEVVRGVAWF